MSNKNFSRKKYKNNFLTNVIFRVDYPKILELTEKNPPVKLQEKIIDHFQIVKEIPGEIVEFKKKKADFSFKSEKKLGWEFSDKEKTKKAFIDPEYSWIEYYKYSNFEEFFKDIKLIFDPLIDSYPVKVTKRIGLRYINQIHLDSGSPTDWMEYINPDLFVFPKLIAKQEGSTLRYFNFIEVREKECRLKFQYGLFNSEYPNPITRKEFVLDYDCSIEEEIEISNIFDKAIEFHEVANRWFEVNILQKLRDIMGVE